MFARHFLIRPLILWLDSRRGNKLNDNWPCLLLWPQSPENKCFSGITMSGSDFFSLQVTTTLTERHVAFHVDVTGVTYCLQITWKRQRDTDWKSVHLLCMMCCSFWNDSVMMDSFLYTHLYEISFSSFNKTVDVEFILLNNFAVSKTLQSAGKLKMPF